MTRKDITLQAQFEQRKNWRRPLVDAVVATFLCRERSSWTRLIDRYEWLVVERVKGAEKGQFQAHHGGFMDVMDVDVYTAACREVLEETGYPITPEMMSFVTHVGPAIYRSELTLWGDNLKLVISDEEAEPNVGFCLPLFCADVTNIVPDVKTDGEVRGQRWLTLREISDLYGAKGDVLYSRFNYFQMLVPTVLSRMGLWRPAARMVSQPGTYFFSY